MLKRRDGWKAALVLIAIGLAAFFFYQWRQQDKTDEAVAGKVQAQVSASGAVSSAEQSASSVAQSAVNRAAQVEAGLKQITQVCYSDGNDVQRPPDVEAACAAARAYLSRSTRVAPPGITTPHIPDPVTLTQAGRTQTDTAVIERTRSVPGPTVTLPTAPARVATQTETRSVVLPPVVRTVETTRTNTVMQEIINRQVVTQTQTETETETETQIETQNRTTTVTETPAPVTETATETQSTTVTETPPAVTVTPPPETVTAPGGTITVTAPPVTDTVTATATTTETATTTVTETCIRVLTCPRP